MFKFLAIAVILTASILSAKADGNKLLSQCSNNDGLDWGFCIGFISGVASSAPDVCLPNGVTQGQTRDIVVKFLRDNPEYRHYSENRIAVVALSVSFPCTQKASN